MLVDRLWPRGMSKQRLEYDRWAKDLSPSPELRVWYGHRPERFDEFARLYRRELRERDHLAALAELRRIGARGPLTLLTATEDVEHSGASVLARVLSREAK